jgi:PAS domain S-box-containing protein
MAVDPIIGAAVAAYSVLMVLWTYTLIVSYSRMCATRATSPFVSRLYFVLIFGSSCAIVACLNDIAVLTLGMNPELATTAPLQIVLARLAPFCANAMALFVALAVAVRGGLRQIEREQIHQVQRRQELESVIHQRGLELQETGEQLATDRRERERIELELRAEHAMLDAIMKTSIGAICVVNTEGEIVFANGAAQTIFCITNDDMATECQSAPEWRLMDVFGNLLPEGQTPFRRVINAGEPIHNMQHAIHWPDGSTRFLDINGAPLFGVDGAISGVVFLISDITQRKANEELLRDSEKRFRLMVEGLPSGAVFVERGNIFLNRAAEEITGYSRSELSTVEQWFWALYGETSVEAREEYERIRNEKFSEVYVGTIRRKDGVSRIIECSGYSSESAAVWILRDVTDQVKTEEIRRHLQSQLFETRSLEDLAIMAEGVAHDCNNILTGILGSADLARHELSAGDGARAYIEEIAHGAERAADLCTMMMAYTGDAEQKMEAVDVNVAVRDMVRFLYGSDGTVSGVTIQYDLDEAVQKARTDNTHIRKVLLALLQNAAEAIGEKYGTIQVSTRSGPVLANAHGNEGLPPGEYVQISVKDTGCGMDSAVLAKACDPFFTTKPDARGLGLTYALGIVRASNGNIVFESKKGKGTTATVFLPVASSRAEGEKPTIPDSLWRGSGTILVVDDELNVREITKRMLEKLGFDVVLAANGDEAVSAVDQHDNFAAVILDLTMPNMDGESTFEQIRRRKPHLPVLIASGYDVKKVSGRFRNGVTSFLQKPFPMHVLSAHLRLALDRGAKTSVQ